MAWKIDNKVQEYFYSESQILFMKEDEMEKIAQNIRPDIKATLQKLKEQASAKESELIDVVSDLYENISAF